MAVDGSGAERDLGKEDGLGAVLGRFLGEAHGIPPDKLIDLIVDAAQQLGAADARVWLADHQQRQLVNLAATAADEVPPLAIDGSAGGRAYVQCDVVDVAAEPHHRHAWLPLLDGVDRVGVLEVVLDGGPSDAGGTDDGPATAVEELRHLASVATAEIITRGQYSDVFARVRRRRPMSVAAELQWQGLPPGSFTTRDVAVAGMLEPAYEVGGDTFDYAHAHDVLDVAILDAVGHTLDSSLISSLALGAYRNRRREGGELGEAAALMDRVVREQFGSLSFVTGQLGQLDTIDGRFRWLNAGHPLPLLVRGSHIEPLVCPPGLPFGLGAMLTGVPPDDRPSSERWQVAEVQLEPGDGVLFYTDGVIEAQRAGGEQFGVHRLTDFVSNAFAAAMSPAETVRRLSNAIVDFHGGQLRDDAATFLVVWRPESR